MTKSNGSKSPGITIEKGKADDQISELYTAEMPDDIAKIIDDLKPKLAESYNQDEWYKSAIKILNGDNPEGQGPMYDLLAAGAERLNPHLTEKGRKSLGLAFHEFAYSYQMTKNYQVALDFYKYALHFSNHRYTVAGVGVASLRLKKYSEALKWFKKSRQMGYFGKKLPEWEKEAREGLEKTIKK